MSWPSARSTAAAEAPAWSAGAAAWAEHWGRLPAPARHAVAAAAELAPGTSVLDVGCGSGEFCQLAAALGARVSGIDAAKGMVVIAKRRLPEADLRVGPIEQLPWSDRSFDVVTGFNAFQFAADFVAALAEAARVTRSGGRVAICNWGRVEDRELSALLEPLRELEPPRPPGVPPYDPPPIGEPGVLEELAEQAGLTPEHADEVRVLYEVPDLATLERALLAVARVNGITPVLAEGVVARTAERAAAPFRRADGSYRFENRFRYLIARLEPGG
jgi:SAM-dependent methyltransferase